MPPSPTVFDDIELQTHLEHSALRFSNIERFTDGSGYGCIIIVRSAGFGCTRRFYFDDWHLSKALEAFRAMEQGVPNEAIIKGQWEKDYVKFVMDRLGHVVVSGEVFEYSALSQSLKFAFCTDQTVISPLSRSLATIRGA